MTNLITKSELLSGIRCPRQLWLRTYQANLARPFATSELAAAAGIELGNIARCKYKEGVLVGHVEQPDLAVINTSRLLSGDKAVPLFEAAFVHGDVLMRTDLLVPSAVGWRMVELKSSGSVKDRHLIDCAVQLWVLEGTGISVSKVCLAHVDGSFEYAGFGDYAGLLIEEDVTDKVREILGDVPHWLDAHQDILSGAKPDMRMEGKCDGCVFLNHCGLDMPEYPVSILPYGRKLVDELQEAGIADVRDIPAGLLNSERHVIVWRATQTGTAYISRVLQEEMAKLSYPRFFLDFESINFVIPRWVGTRPNQQIPFQWSCHIEREENELEHREFLDASGHAPMRAFAESLIAGVEEKGPIIVYGAFEQTILKQLITFCPDLERPLRDIIDRLTDLLPMLREHYYHPNMKGSWSIKAVLPTIAPHLDYAMLEEVQNGMMAQQAYMNIINPDTTSEQREQTICNLLKYCELDTLAMVEIVSYFERSGALSERNLALPMQNTTSSG